MNEEIMGQIANLKPEELTILKWHLMRRKDQTAPDPLPFVWFLLGGRNSGKTFTAAYHVLEYVVNLPHTPQNREVRVALVGAVFDDVKKVMVEGATGILGILPKEYGPDGTGKWNRTIGELTITFPGPPERKVIFSSYTSTTPGKLRGPQFHIAWWDEPSKSEDSDINPDETDTTWSNLSMALRLGPAPHLIVSGTPTPCKLVQFLLAHPNCVTSTMTTWNNREHLPPAWVTELERLDPNSRAYKQEVLGMVLLDNPNALFSEDDINGDRANSPEGETIYKVLGYDPAMSSGENSDEVGIVLVGYTPEVKTTGARGGRPVVEKHAEAYVLKDLSGHMAPSEHADLVIRTVIEENVSDLVVETNQGSDVIVTLLSQALKEQTAEYVIRKHRKPRSTDFGSVKRFTVKYSLHDGTTNTFLISAINVMKSKKIRAETVSYNYAFHRVHHPVDLKQLNVCTVDGCKTSLETQMTGWNPNNTSGSASSPDRLDALVYALHFVFGRHALHSSGTTKIGSPVPRSNTPMTHQQKNPGKKVIRASSIYSMDVGSGIGGGRMDPDLLELLYNRGH